MKVDLYEKIWMWGAGVMLSLFFGSTAMAAFGKHFQPPSHIETINPATVLKDPHFAKQGVSVDGSGRVHVAVVALMYTWLPTEFTLPADRPVTFHLTSIDVTHGFEIVRTNGQSMVVPGYISQFTTQFAAGEYLIACNEYCGIGHHTMATKMHVVPLTQWQAPTAASPFTSTSEHDHE